jgi:hypothetical protein
MTRRFPLSLVMALAVAALTSGLARPAGGTAEARKGGTLRISTHSDVDYVDPALGWFPRSFMLGFGTCAKLFNYPDRQGAEGTKLIPPRSCARTPFRVTGGRTRSTCTGRSASTPARQSLLRASDSRSTATPI